MRSSGATMGASGGGGFGLGSGSSLFGKKKSNTAAKGISSKVDRKESSLATASALDKHRRLTHIDDMYVNEHGVLEKRDPGYQQNSSRITREKFKNDMSRS